ncbi:MAG TPA: hypothetical protein VNO75_00220, partial [Gemmatimonadaceae bacterium]|nr:hypothetical protein [Gemmatimonadaceae bacterium]
MTDLRKFSEAYATMTVAVYEPLIVNWVSSATIATTADAIALRLQKARRIKRDPRLPTALATRGTSLRRGVPAAGIRATGTGQPLRADVTDIAGYDLPEGAVRSVPIEGNPDAVAVDDDV